MAHQLNIFILLFGVLQGWLLSFWFFRNRQKEQPNILIALLLFVVGLQLTSKVITKMWLMEHAFLFYVLSYKLPYLIGPLLFLYCRTKSKKPLDKRDLLHVFPFVISSMLSFDVFGMELYIHPYPDGAFKLLSLFTYSYLCYRITDPSSWKFIRTVIIAEAIIIIALALMVVYYGRFPDVRWLFTVLTFLVYWMTYKAIARSVPFREGANVVALRSQKGPKYAHSSLKQEEAVRIEKDLHKLMQEEKSFLDPALTIDGVAMKLSTNRHNLSQVLNERLKKTWPDYLNEWRLEEARKRLTDPSNSRFTIAAIALDSGFNSVSSFNDVFKKRFGTTPSKFRNQFTNKMSA